MTFPISTNLSLSKEGYAELPYSGQALYRVNQWRNRHHEYALSSLATRVSCQFLYPMIALIALSETIGKGAFLLLCEVFSQLRMIAYDRRHFIYHRLNRSLRICQIAIDNSCDNFFVKNIYKKDGLLWERTVGFERLKCLSHWLDLKGKVVFEGQEIDLEGNFSHRQYPFIIRSLAAFMKCPGFSKFSLSLEGAHALQNALHFASQRQNAHKIIEKIQSGELCFLDTGWERHGICLTFCGEYLAIGNGGPRGEFLANFSRATSDCHVYKIDPKKVSTAIIQKILDCPSTKEQESVKYFYHTLPALLSEEGQLTQDAWCHQFRKFSLGQDVGNCSLYSILATLPFAWAMSISKTPSFVTIQQAFLEAKLFRNWAAVRYATHYKDGEEFRNPNVSKRIAEARAEKKWNASIYATILQSSFLKKFPLLSKVFLSSDIWLSAQAVATGFIFLSFMRHFRESYLLPIGGLSSVFLGAFSSLSAISEKHYFSKFFISYAWKGFEKFSCEEEILEA